MDDTGILETSPVGKAVKVAQACVRCRQKKNRCDGQTPSCSNCMARGEECAYRGYQRKRGPGRSKLHIRALEQRLSDLESRMQRPDPDSQGENSAPSPQRGPQALGAKPHSARSAPRTEGEAPPAADPISQGTDALEIKVQNLDIMDAVHKRLPIFKMVTDNLAGDYNSPAVAESLRRIPGIHIPVREAEAFLLENTIREICEDLPIFDVPSFIAWIRQPATLTRRDQPSKWVCLNATTALGGLVKMLNGSYAKIVQFPWAYLKNAHEALPEMMLHGADVWGVQAGLVMATFMLRASGDTRAAAMFLSVAVRTMHSGSLQSARPGQESKTGGNAFWAAYVLDTEISLNCGVPPLLHEEDIDTSLPNQGDPHGDTGDSLLSDSLGATVFALRAELATIQARIRKQLYAAKSFRLSDDELIETVARLASDLDTWRSGVPTGIQPGRLGHVSDSVVQTPVIMLHLSYYNSVSMIHWAVRRHTAWERRDATEVHREQITASASRVKIATKIVVRLLPRIRSKPLTDIWRLLLYIVAPGITFLALILEDPSEVQTRLNLRMLELLVEFMEALVKEEGLDLQGVLTGSTAMWQVATGAVNEGPSIDMTGAASPHDVHILLREMTHPMLVAQALLGNIPNRDTAVARSLSAALGMPWGAEAIFSPWVSTGMRPGTYGFRYDLA